MKTKYLRSHILLVSKEDLESIKEGHKRYFQNKQKETLLKWVRVFRRAKEDLFVYLWKPLQTKEPIDDLYRDLV